MCIRDSISTCGCLSVSASCLNGQTNWPDFDMHNGTKMVSSAAWDYNELKGSFKSLSEVGTILSV